MSLHRCTPLKKAIGLGLALGSRIRAPGQTLVGPALVVSNTNSRITKEVVEIDEPTVDLDQTADLKAFKEATTQAIGTTTMRLDGLLAQFDSLNQVLAERGKGI